MFDLEQFMDLIGWADWFDQYMIASSAHGEAWSFSDLVLGTIPMAFQLCFILFLLNWIMGMISDTVKLRLGGARF